jgi:hypothetical protein
MKKSLLYLCVLYVVVRWYNGRRTNVKLTRSGILAPRMAPWLRLLHYGDNHSFLTLTGFTRVVFRRLEAVLLEGEPPRKGRTPELDFTGQLGLYLLYLGSRMALKQLCLIFGIVPSTASVFINRFAKMVPKKLRHEAHAEVRFPSQQRMAELADLVHRREPGVRNIIGFVDGLALPVQCSSQEREQALYYNGYHHDTTINNVFLFLADGKIGFACINFPGSWHDSRVCTDLIEAVLENIGIHAICVDQGFPRGGELLGVFVGPMSKRQRRLVPQELLETVMRKHALYVSLRQASEWGMRALQGTFPRIKSRLTSDKEKRKNIVHSVVLLHNFRTSYIGLNQIATVFNREYEQYINLDGYDRIARYFRN